MLKSSDVLKLQSQNVLSTSLDVVEDVDFAVYVSNCRDFIIRNKSENYNKLEDMQKSLETDGLIQQFVTAHNAVKVKGYYTDDGITDTPKLLEDLKNAISGIYVIDEAFEDDTVDEVQINEAGSVFVIRGGVSEPYFLKNGKRGTFVSDEEIVLLLRRLVDDHTGNVPQFSPGNPVLSAKTFKHQYRVHAIHNSLHASHQAPHNGPVTNAAIRKYRRNKLSLGDLVDYNSITMEMGVFLKMLSRTDANVFCVGPVNSGKTTLLNIVAKELPLDMRIFLAQNPTEIYLDERDGFGSLLRNVIHLETNEAMGFDLTFLGNQSLRQSMDAIVIGEMRSSSEFESASRIMAYGTKVLSTGHAKDAKDFARRFSMEIATETKSSDIDALKRIADKLHVVVTQYKFRNGDRKVMEIAEVMGLDSDGQILTNVLYKYELTGEVEIIEGKRRVVGKFVRKNPISNKLKDMFYAAQYTRDEIADYLKPVEEE